MIAALQYLGKENVDIKTIQTIKNHISSKEFNVTLTFIVGYEKWGI